MKDHGSNILHRCRLMKNIQIISKSILFVLLVNTQIHELLNYRAIELSVN